MTPEPAALLAVAVIPVGITLVGFMVARLVRLARQPALATVPVVARQAVTFAEAGAAELAIEGPRFTSRFAGLGYELVDASGTQVPIDNLWARTQTSGVGSTRLSLKRLTVPRPGTYELRISGLAPDGDYSGCSIAFVRPIGLQVAATIPALLGAVGLTGASIAIASALLLAGGGSTAVDPVDGASAPPMPAVLEQHGGRALAADGTRLAGAKELVWPILQMRVQLPADWIVQKMSSTELDVRDPTTPSTYVLARVTPMPAGPSVSDYVQAHVTHAREQLATDVVAGYATKPIGTVPGVVTLERRSGDAWLVVWTGFEPAQLGSLSITILLGATDADFKRDERLLGAILDSVRFE